MAVDDAYSRYVMTLKPARYARFRNIAVGHKAAESEVAIGLDGSIPGRLAYRDILTASQVGSGVFVPALSSATFYKLTGTYNFINVSGDHTKDSTFSTALTTNVYGYPVQSPHMKSMSVNLWYRNRTAPANGTWQRLFSISGGEWWNNGFTPGAPIFSFFNWENTRDSGLIEALFTRQSRTLGTSYQTNPGNSEMYRYASTTTLPVNTVAMVTFVLSTNRLQAYRNGVRYMDFTWNPSHYRMCRNQGGDGWVLGCGSWQRGTSALFSNYGVGDVAVNADFAEFSLHNRPLEEYEIKELYRLGTVGTHSMKYYGTVTDGAGLPLSGRLVRAHNYATGAVMGEATSGVDGTFNVFVPPGSKNAYILAFDDLGVAPDYNAAIQANLLPVTA